MSQESQVFVCQRCGFGFILTTDYRDCLRRWGARVIVPMLCPNCFHQSGPLRKERGQVKWYSKRKRYGFIVTQGGSEVFFHQNQLIDGDERKLHEGRQTQFHVRSSVNGVEALNVELLGR